MVWGELTAFVAVGGLRVIRAFTYVLWTSLPPPAAVLTAVLVSRIRDTLLTVNVVLLHIAPPLSLVELICIEHWPVPSTTVHVLPLTNVAPAALFSRLKVT